MNEFNVIVIMNEAMIKLLKDKNENYETNLKIQKYLEDETIFFKINKSSAYIILQNVGVKKDKLEETYKKLTSADAFYELLDKGKINPDDNNLIIKYHYNNLF